MTRRALVIGGTGPTGPHVIAGLLQRGMDVTILHRGVHEPPGLPDVEHIHADPHFSETIEPAIAGREFDVVFAMYGRVKTIAEVVTHRCDHLIAVGGVPVYRGAIDPESNRPSGVAVNVREDGPLADEAAVVPQFSRLVVEAERAVLRERQRGSYRASLARYPIVYGPRNIVSWEWSVIKRVLDRRPFMILPDGGLGIASRSAARNAAEILLFIADNPERSDGQAYNCVDRDQFTFRQWVELIVDQLGGKLEIAALPLELAVAAQPSLMPLGGIRPHLLLDGSKASMELGYQEVVSARDAIAESVNWVCDNPPPDGSHLFDNFDYESEDRLVGEYRQAVDRIRDRQWVTVPDQRHPFPHPKSPGTGTDEAGR